MYREVYKEKISSEENKIIDFWKSIDLLKTTIELRKDCDKFVFYDGPPTANGKPGLHHVVSRTLKDGICRYKSMQGFLVERKAGWDTHGLPVEIEVEKRLGIENKQQIEEYGIAKFNKECKNSVFEYEQVWRKQSEKMGYLIDMDNPYITLKNEYIESVWWIIKKFFDAGYIYEGHKIIPYCSRCGTGLASHEVAQGYKMVKQETVTVAFKRVDKDEYFLAWTTTPWTLAANVMLAVNPEVTYVRAKQDDNVYILAKERVSDVLVDNYEIIDEFLGKELEHIEYEPLMPFVEVEGKAHFVALADYVTTEDGTGVVHSAPAFGEDDFNTGERYSAPVIQPVNLEGKYTETPWKGMFVMDADEHIIKWLRENGKLYKKQRMEHNYPHCWRCDTPLLYYANPSYYIKMSLLSEKLLENNSKVNWYPSHIGDKRFGNWLANIRDWAISRSRYWGTPLNIWNCECGHSHSIGSIEELKERAVEKIDEIELHKPYVDEVKIKCDKCGGLMERVPYVLDVWFDSGSMPFAQMHYPFEHKDDFDNYFPADFICEGIDQTRGWFYSLMAISTFIAGKSPYKNVLVNDLLLDSEGKKMSKSRGTTVDAFELFDQYGADCVRWYLNYASPAWVPTRFSSEGIKETYSKFFVTFKNIYHLFSLYANTDKINVNDFIDEKLQPSLLDKWVISKLNICIEEVTKAYESYDLTSVTRIIQDFIVEDVSNWYIRRSRRRYWKYSLDNDKKSAFKTTYEIILNLCKMAAPVAPFITEAVYKALTDEKSVHLSSFPVSDKTLIDLDLDRKINLSREVVKLGRAARESVSIKVRQPISRVVIDKKFKDDLSGLEDIIIEELNVKEIVYAENVSDFVDFVIKPNFPVLGPKLGKKMGLLQKKLKELDAQKFGDEIREGKTVTIDLDGESLELTSENIDVQVNAKEDFTISKSGEVFVLIETKLTDELLLEGYAREFISKIQQMRKNMDYNVSDHIKVLYHSEDRMYKAIDAHRSFIMEELLADELERKENDGEVINLNGIDTTIYIERV